jgi:hypothetical protein
MVSLHQLYLQVLGVLSGTVKLVIILLQVGVMRCGTKTPRLGREDRGPTMSWPTRPKDTSQEAHNRGGLEIIIDKSCKLGK